MFKSLLFYFSIISMKLEDRLLKGKVRFPEFRSCLLKQYTVYKGRIQKRFVPAQEETTFKEGTHGFFLEEEYPYSKLLHY